MPINTRKIPSFDPFDVKKQLIDLTDSYFNINNLDTYESGFIGYFIQALTFATSDVLFQGSMSYNEAFMDKAILPSSVANIASQLDYHPQVTKPASGLMTIAIPLNLNSDMMIKISTGSQVKAGSIPYRVKNSYYLIKDSTGITVTSQNIDTGLVSDVAFNVELRNGKLSVVFDVEIWQIQIYMHNFIFENPRLHVFYEESMSNYSGNIYDMLVTVDNVRYKQTPSIYQAKSTDKCYELIINNSTNSFTVKFGNGVYGFLPSANSEALIRLYTTLGTSGNIVPNMAKLDERIVDAISGKEIMDVTSYNSMAINNGVDGESIEDIKRHTREGISSAKRLVTENDYFSFQGITGLSNIRALPVVTKHDVSGNDISIFMSMFDENNEPIPTASIPVPMDKSKSIIKKGQRLEYDGLFYKSPFKIVYDDSYDIPIGRYYYSLSNLNVAPKLYNRIMSDDVLMGLRQIQAKIYPDDDQIEFIAEVYKLKEMDHSRIKGELILNAGSSIFETIELNVSKVYDDKITLNLASTILSDINMPSGPITWTVNLYWNTSSKSSIENWCLYNTYHGECKLYFDGVLASNICSSIVSEHQNPNTSFGVVDISFKAAPTKDNGYFYIPITMFDTLIPIENMMVKVKINDNEYDCVFGGEAQNVRTYRSNFIPISKFPVGQFLWNVEVYLKDDNTDTWSLSNTYAGHIIILTEGRTHINMVVNSKPTFVGKPSIELVHLGLNNIQIVNDDSTDSYKFKCDISKMSHNNGNKISVRLIVEKDIYNLESDDNINAEMLFSGSSQQNIDQQPDESHTPSNTVTFVSPNISSSDIPLGSISFQIELSYDGNIHAVYKQSAIFHHDMTQICYSNVSKNLSRTSYAWLVPVISEEYYDTHIQFIDQNILNQLAVLKETFSEYKMLTDKINLKFIRTFGKSINMRLNRYNPIPAKIYNETEYIDMPPKLKVKVYIKKTTNNTISAIVGECKKVLYTFLQLKSGFHTNIYRSELARFLHDVVDDIEFCEVLEPTDDIVYDFDIKYIPKYNRDELYKYCPELIWFKQDLIEIETALI